MRCTRCDGLAVPQAVGLTADGCVVFGWCLGCLSEDDCTLVEIEDGVGLRGLDRRARIVPGPAAGMASRARREPARRPVSRRLGLSGIASLMGTWALVLLGAALLRWPTAGVPSGLGRSWFNLLLAAGGGMMALSLLMAAATVERAKLGRLAFKAVQVGSTATAFTILIWGIVHHVPRESPLIVTICGVALGLSWTTHWAERRGTAPLPASPVPSKPGHALKNQSSHS